MGGVCMRPAGPDVGNTVLLVEPHGPPMDGGRFSTTLAKDYKVKGHLWDLARTKGPSDPAFIHAPQMWLKIYKPTLVDLFFSQDNERAKRFLAVIYVLRSIPFFPQPSIYNEAHVVAKTGPSINNPLDLSVDLVPGTYCIAISAAQDASPQAPNSFQITLSCSEQVTFVVPDSFGPRMEASAPPATPQHGADMLPLISGEQPASEPHFADVVDQHPHQAQHADPPRVPVLPPLRHPGEGVLAQQPQHRLPAQKVPLLPPLRPAGTVGAGTQAAAAAAVAAVAASGGARVEPLALPRGPKPSAAWAEGTEPLPAHVVRPLAVRAESGSKDAGPRRPLQPLQLPKHDVPAPAEDSSQSDGQLLGWGVSVQPPSNSSTPLSRSSSRYSARSSITPIPRGMPRVQRPHALVSVAIDGESSLDVGWVPGRRGIDTGDADFWRNPTVELAAPVKAFEPVDVVVSLCLPPTAPVVTPCLFVVRAGAIIASSGFRVSPQRLSVTVRMQPDDTVRVVCAVMEPEADLPFALVASSADGHPPPQMTLSSVSQAYFPPSQLWPAALLGGKWASSTPAWGLPGSARWGCSPAFVVQGTDKLDLRMETPNAAVRVAVAVVELRQQDYETAGDAVADAKRMRAQLSALAYDDVWSCTAISDVARGVVRLRTALDPLQRYAVLCCADAGAAAEFALTLRSPRPLATAAPLQPAVTALTPVPLVWQGGLGGGHPGDVSFTRAPYAWLHVTKDVEVSVTLERSDEPPLPAAAVFILAPPPADAPLAGRSTPLPAAWCTADRVVSASQWATVGAAVVTARLPASVQPYIVVCSTLQPGAEGMLSLSAVLATPAAATQQFSIHAPPPPAWFDVSALMSVVHMKGQWRAPCMGGGPSADFWMRNPQVQLTVDVAARVHVCVWRGSTQNSINFALIKRVGEFTKPKYNKNVVVMEGEWCARGASSRRAWLEPGEYVLYFMTDVPGRQGDFYGTIHADAGVSVKPLSVQGVELVTLSDIAPPSHSECQTAQVSSEQTLNVDWMQGVTDVPLVMNSSPLVLFGPMTGVLLVGSMRPQHACAAVCNKDTADVAGDCEEDHEMALPTPVPFAAATTVGNGRGAVFAAPYYFTLALESKLHGDNARKLLTNTVTWLARNQPQKSRVFIYGEPPSSPVRALLSSLCASVTDFTSLRALPDRSQVDLLWVSYTGALDPTFDQRDADALLRLVQGGRGLLLCAGAQAAPLLGKLGMVVVPDRLLSPLEATSLAVLSPPTDAQRSQYAALTASAAARLLVSWVDADRMPAVGQMLAPAALALAAAAYAPSNDTFLRPVLQRAFQGRTLVDPAQPMSPVYVRAPFERLRFALGAVERNTVVAVRTDNTPAASDMTMAVTASLHPSALVFPGDVQPSDPRSHTVSAVAATIDVALRRGARVCLGVWAAAGQRISVVLPYACAGTGLCVRIGSHTLDTTRLVHVPLNRLPCLSSTFPVVAPKQVAAVPAAVRQMLAQPGPPQQLSQLLSSAASSPQGSPKPGSAPVPAPAVAAAASAEPAPTPTYVTMDIVTEHGGLVYLDATRCGHDVALPAVASVSVHGAVAAAAYEHARTTDAAWQDALHASRAPWCHLAGQYVSLCLPRASAPLDPASVLRYWDALVAVLWKHVAGSLQADTAPPHAWVVGDVQCRRGEAIAAAAPDVLVHPDDCGLLLSAALHAADPLCVLFVLRALACSLALAGGLAADDAAAARLADVALKVGALDLHACANALL